MERDLRPVAPAPGGSCPHPSASAQPPLCPPLRPRTRHVRWGSTSCPQASPERPASQVDSRRGSGPSAHIGPDHVPRTPRGTPDGRQRRGQKEVRAPSPSREPSSRPRRTSKTDSAALGPRAGSPTALLTQSAISGRSQ